jgi:hypothetical protein
MFGMSFGDLLVLSMIVAAAVWAVVRESRPGNSHVLDKPLE